MLAHPSECLGIVLRYDEVSAPGPSRLALPAATAAPRVPEGKIRIAVVGCGGFARQFHLPNLKKSPDFHLRALAASSAQNAREMADRYGADYCSTSVAEVLADDSIDAVMILTRDNAHARMTADALRAGKHVFCEKPLAVSLDDCDLLAETITDRSPLCMVGFNRRFSPLVQQMKRVLDTLPGPRLVTYRVNAGRLPRDHWVFDEQYASGRIIGEACHFVDLAAWLIGAELESVSAESLAGQTARHLIEDVAAVIRFTDGSVANVIYTAAGTTAYAKERLEVFCAGTVLALDDFVQLTVRGAKRLDVRDRSGNKGHAAELAHFAAAIRGAQPLGVSHVDGIRATLACLAICESVQGSPALPDPVEAESI